MAAELIYAFRVMRLPLLDAGGSAIGRIEDLVAVPGRPARHGKPASPPRLVGFVASSQHRRIFVNANRVGDLTGDGVRLKSWDVDLNPFKPRPGEVLIGDELIDRRIGDETVSDIGMVEAGDGRSNWWEIEKVRLATKGSLGRRSSYRLADVREVPGLFDSPTAMEAEAARLRDFHPTDVAAVIRALPDQQRRQLADALDDHRLADVLEELTEEEQVRIVEGLDRERLEGIFDEMEYDDVADLLGQMTAVQQELMLDAMDDEDEEVVRRLLSYEEGTAGGLMTPEVILLGATATVAEALAQVRDPDWVVSIATQIFVCQPPFKTPTGKFLGVVHMQRLLREPPAMELRQLIDDVPVVSPGISDRDVAVELASYDLLAIPVCDDAGRLLGAVTVDDVIDRMLGTDWRKRQRRSPDAAPKASPVPR
ncbi:magnesium transporter MgtE N-terminal domain-containing protein [Ilumatobacter nonamiensis]|uniref:magnesium transporter MgtE N-terminal domain-containing protein n=1 Tax=Ilumatobacter nonamiensis TaxID=467093 RepID=UPI00034811C1|nr:CBS domain-containing protein [Ilumatobacter nonamiensis]